MYYWLISTAIPHFSKRLLCEGGFYIGCDYKPVNVPSDRQNITYLLPIKACL